MKKVFKQVMITGMALAMVVGGSTAAFADNDKGKGNDNDRDRYEKSWNGSSNGNANGGIKFENKGQINIIVNFNDMNGADVEWAIKNIASLSAKRIFQGYEDGSFKPRNTISRVEAITAAVRLLGLEAQAQSQTEMSTKLNFKDADKIPSWAVGYVSVALENDLFGESETMVQPDKPADRLWATTLLVKALKLDAEAKAKMNTQLQFKDAKEIPAGSVGYVAVAVEKGLIDGFENNTFRPNTPVTRAQMAALVDRADQQTPDFEKDAVKGTISAVNGSVLTITKKDNTSTQVLLDATAWVFSGGVKVLPTEITVGDEVTVKLVANTNVAFYVDITKSGAVVNNLQIDGKLYSYTRSTQGKINQISVTHVVYGTNNTASTVTSVFPVAENYVLTPNNEALLVQNQNIQVKGVNNVVNSIEFK